MSTNFQNKLIVLTGGASGIGLATAHLLCSRGANLHIADVNPSALSDAVSSIKTTSLGPGASIAGSLIDVRDRKSVETWIHDVVGKHGKLDGAVNLAAVVGKQLGIANVENIDDEEWDLVLGVNLGGMLNCLRAQIPVMKAGNGSEIGGSIVNAASVAGVIGIPTNATYVASKHAVVGLTRAAAKEQGPRGVRVNCLAPGPIDTPMASSKEAKDGINAMMPYIAMKRVGKASEVAELIAWLLCDGSSYITGTVQNIDGGWVC